LKEFCHNRSGVSVAKSFETVPENKKAHPFLRIGFDLNQSFGYPHPRCLTTSKKQQDDNHPGLEAPAYADLLRQGYGGQEASSGRPACAKSYGRQARGDGK
jgi:hypothetical protein